MSIGQISNAKFPPKAHIESGPAASKPQAGRKVLGCLYHATDALPDGSLAAALNQGEVQLCKQNNATTPAPAWATVPTCDWCGVATLVGGGGTAAVVLAAAAGLDISQIRANTVVKYWVQTPVEAGGRGILTATIQAGASVTITSTDDETSAVYVEVTY